MSIEKNNKKLAIKSLQIKSFVTSIDKKDKETIEGRENINNAGDLSRLGCLIKKTKRLFFEPVPTFRRETPCTQTPDIVSRLGSCYPYNCPHPLPNCSIKGVSCTF